MFRVDRRRLILFLSACWVLGLVSNFLIAWTLGSLDTRWMHDSFRYLEWRGADKLVSDEFRVERSRAWGKWVTVASRSGLRYRTLEEMPALPDGMPYQALLEELRLAQEVYEFRFGWPLPALGCTYLDLENQFRPPDEWVTSGVMAPPLEVKSLKVELDAAWGGWRYGHQVDVPAYCLAWGPQWLGLIVNSFILGIMWVLLCSAGTLLTVMRLKWRKWGNRCVRCRYRLHESVAERCSECGWTQAIGVPWPTKINLVTAWCAIPLLAGGTAAFGWWQCSRLVRPTPLHIAAARNDPDEIRRLVALGATVDARIPSDVSWSIEIGDTTPLLWAVINGSGDAAAALVEAGADVKSLADRFAPYESVLDYAVRWDKPEVVRHAFELGVRLSDLRNYERWTYSAATSTRHEIARVALTYATEAEIDQLVAAFVSEMVAGCRTRGFDVLLEFVPPDRRISMAVSGMHEAVRDYCPDVVEYFLSIGVDPNASEFGTNSPLMRAVECGHIEIVRLLLEHGADPTLDLTGDGITPLKLAEHYAKRFPDHDGPYSPRAMADLMRQYLDEDDDR